VYLGEIDQWCYYGGVRQAQARYKRDRCCYITYTKLWQAEMQERPPASAMKRGMELTLREVRAGEQAKEAG
jgi:hypothetical protein